MNSQLERQIFLGLLELSKKHKGLHRQVFGQKGEPSYLVAQYIRSASSLYKCSLYTGIYAPRDCTRNSSFDTYHGVLGHHSRSIGDAEKKDYEVQQEGIKLQFFNTNILGLDLHQFAPVFALAQNWGYISPVNDKFKLGVSGLYLFNSFPQKRFSLVVPHFYSMLSLSFSSSKYIDSCIFLPDPVVKLMFSYISFFQVSYSDYDFTIKVNQYRESSTMIGFYLDSAALPLCYIWYESAWENKEIISCSTMQKKLQISSNVIHKEAKKLAKTIREKISWSNVLGSEIFGLREFNDRRISVVDSNKLLELISDTNVSNIRIEQHPNCDISSRKTPPIKLVGLKDDKIKWVTTISCCIPRS